MKIIINSEDINKKIYLPNCLIKSKFILNKLSKDNNEELKKFIISIYKDLRKYIRKNGHFIIVDIESNDGENIKIII